MKKKYYVYELDIKLVMLFAFLILGLTFGICYLIMPEFTMESIKMFISDMNFIFFVVIDIFYMVLHELVHCLSYVLNGGKYNKITFGIELEKGVFYCLCKQNITKRNILISAMAPFTILGIVTLVISFIIHSPYLFLLSIFNISGCSGDIFTTWFISKLPNNIEFTEFDSATSFAIYSDKDISNIKCLGLKYIDVKDEVPREDFKKIRVSTGSKKLILGFIGIFLLMFVIGFIIGLIIARGR